VAEAPSGNEDYAHALELLAEACSDLAAILRQGPVVVTEVDAGGLQRASIRLHGAIAEMRRAMSDMSSYFPTV